MRAIQFVLKIILYPLNLDFDLVTGEFDQIHKCK